MWVIVKHVVVIEDNVSVNMLAIQIKDGCHRSLEDATRVYDDLNDRENTDVYDCVFVLNHS